MTDNGQTIDGVNLETLESFAEHATENPDEVQFELAARSTYEGTCAHSLAKIDAYELGGDRIARETRSYTIPYGGWREVLEAAGWVGPVDRPEPIEVALSALASCINVGISLNAVAHGVELEHLETSVTAEFDPGVLFSLADLDQADEVFTNVTADVEVHGPDVDEDQIDEWARRAPVYTLISLAQDIEFAINTPAEVPADD